MVALRDLGMGRTENGAATRMKGARARIFRGETNLDELERYRSGQTGQAVNLLAQAYGGSNPPLSTTAGLKSRASSFRAGIAQLARAQAFQAWGRGFEPRFPLHGSRGEALR